MYRPANLSMLIQIYNLFAPTPSSQLGYKKLTCGAPFLQLSQFDEWSTVTIFILKAYMRRLMRLHSTASYLKQGGHLRGVVVYRTPNEAEQIFIVWTQTRLFE